MDLYSYRLYGVYSTRFRLYTSSYPVCGLPASAERHKADTQTLSASTSDSLTYSNVPGCGVSDSKPSLTAQKEAANAVVNNVFCKPDSLVLSGRRIAKMSVQIQYGLWLRNIICDRRRSQRLSRCKVALVRSMPRPDPEGHDRKAESGSPSNRRRSRWSESNYLFVFFVLLLRMRDLDVFLWICTTEQPRRRKTQVP